MLGAGGAPRQIVCSVLDHSQQEDTEGLEHGQRRTVELGKGLEPKSDEDLLRELWVFSLEKRRFRGDFIISAIA